MTTTAMIGAVAGLFSKVAPRILRVSRAVPAGSPQDARHGSTRRLRDTSGTHGAGAADVAPLTFPISLTGPCTPVII